MPRLRVAPLASALLLAIASLPAAARSSTPEEWVLCRPNALLDFWNPDLPKDGVREESPAELAAERFDVSNEKFYVLEGDVEIRRADQYIAADTLRYDVEQERYEAEGNVHYQDRGLLLGADKAVGELGDEDRNTLDNVRYQLLDARGNGQARRAVVIGDRSKLDHVTYTTCDPGSTG